MTKIDVGTKFWRNLDRMAESAIAELSKKNGEKKSKKPKKIQKYRDIPHCIDREINLYRLFGYHGRDGYYRSGLAPKHYVLDWNESNWRHDWSKDKYSSYLKKIYEFRSLCQKPSPENKNEFALYATVPYESTITMSDVGGRFKGIQDCGYNQSVLRISAQYDKRDRKKSYYTTLHPASLIPRNHFAIGHTDVPRLLGFLKDFRADDLCQKRVEWRSCKDDGTKCGDWYSHSLFYAYDQRYGYRGGSTAYYRNVPQCKEGSSQYRLLWRDYKWYLREAPFVIRNVEYNPANENVYRLRQRYAYEGKAGRVCEMVVRGAKDCIKRHYDADCKNARVGLFFEFDNPYNGLKDLLDQPASAKVIGKFMQHSLKYLPKQVRKYAISSEKLKDEEQRLDTIKKEKMVSDWFAERMDRSLAKPVLDKVAVPLGLDDNERGYVEHIISAGQRFGVLDKDMADIALDLLGVTKTKFAFMHAFRTVVSLRIAVVLHAENKRRVGVGISKDFESFTKRTEQLVRDGRIGFVPMNSKYAVGGTTGVYNSSKNVVKYPPFKKGFTIYATLNNVVHEMYHTYQDAMRMRLDKLRHEAVAFERGTKARILLRRALKAGGVKDFDKLYHLQRSFSGKLLNWFRREDSLKAMGYSPHEVRWILDDQVADDRLWDMAMEGFAAQLDGRKATYARSAMQGWVNIIYTETLFTREWFKKTVEFGRMYEAGYKKALTSILADARSKLEKEKQHLESLSKHKNWLRVQGFVSAMLTAERTLYFLGQGDAAKKKEWHAFNKRIFGELLPLYRQEYALRVKQGDGV